MKAILVFDINETAYKGLKTESFVNEVTLHLKHNAFYEIKDVELKPMPKRFEPTILTDYCLGNADGWNACIDEMTGEEDD